MKSFPEKFYLPLHRSLGVKTIQSCSLCLMDVLMSIPSSVWFSHLGAQPQLKPKVTKPKDLVLKRLNTLPNKISGQRASADQVSSIGL